nr:hypothetical protein [Tanacetum cinerariifolium]
HGELVALLFCPGEGRQLDIVRLVEGVVVAHAGRGQHAAGHGFEAHAGQGGFEGEGVFRVEVDERNVHRAVLVLRGRGVQGRDFFIAKRIVGALELHRHKLRILVHLVEVKHVVGRREQHLLLVGQHQGLQHVNGLGQ